MAANDTVCQTDNKTLTFYKQSSLTSGSSSAVNLTLFDSYHGTNLNVTQHSAGVYSGTAETDIIYQQGAGGSAEAPSDTLGATTRLGVSGNVTSSM